MTVLTELKWTTMTALVNERKSPRSFLKNLLFSRSVTLPTEQIEIDVLEGDRDMAPFIKKNGEALYVDGYTAKRYLVEAPNIRIKRSLDPYQMLDTRRPGTTIFPTEGQMSSARAMYVADQLTRMTEMIDNTEEWMAAQVLEGVISYSVNEEEAYTITFPRATANTMDATVDWDVGDATVDISGDFLKASEQMSEETGLIPTHCILGADAFKWFRKDAQVQKLLDTMNYSIGGTVAIGNYAESGAIRVGRLHNIEVWCYPRAINVNGVSTALVDASKAFFVNATGSAENVMYYGAIPDFGAGRQGVFRGRRFSKSWQEEDPSSWTALVHSRPLPVPRRPNSIVELECKAT